jgi:hypothetical protein
MQLLTHPAAEAVDWLTERMPNGVYEQFTEEMEDALRQVLRRFGFDNELENAFHVDRLVGERADLMAADDKLQTLQAHIYTGEHTFAVIGSGRIFMKKYKNKWVPSDLTFTEVLSMSITRTTGSIEVMAKDL